MKHTPDKETDEKVLGIINRRLETGLPRPTYEHLSDITGMSVGGVHAVIARLKRNGFIE